MYYVLSLHMTAHVPVCKCIYMFVGKPVVKIECLLQLLSFNKPGVHGFCLVGCWCSAFSLISSSGIDYKSF